MDSVGVDRIKQWLSNNEAIAEQYEAIPEQ
jgi:hypothetical protein